MDDALRMDEDNDLFNGDIEKPVGLYDLQSFVHQGGRIDGDLFSHRPARVVQGFFYGDLMKPGKGRVPERPSRCREDKAMDILLLVAEQRLEDGAVFTVHGQNLD